jgi:hypothetical protein
VQIDFHTSNLVVKVEPSSFPLRSPTVVVGGSNNSLQKSEGGDPSWIAKNISFSSLLDMLVNP